MATKSQRQATRAHRQRGMARGLVRVEVHAPRKDALLIRALAKALRSESKEAKALRTVLETALVGSEVKTAFDVFGADLPDEVFAGVFDQPRERGWRELAL